MPKLVEVIKRPLRYQARRLLPGEVFRASDNDARLLSKIGRVKPYTGVAVSPPPPEFLTKAGLKAPETPPLLPSSEFPSATVQESLQEPPPPPTSFEPPEPSAPVADNTHEISDLRKEYVQKVGKRPYMGWNADTLRMKISEHDEQN